MNTSKTWTPDSAKSRNVWTASEGNVCEVEVEAGETAGYADWKMPRVTSDNCFAHGPPPLRRFQPSARSDGLVP